MSVICDTYYRDDYWTDFNRNVLMPDPALNHLRVSVFTRNSKFREEGLYLLRKSPDAKYEWLQGDLFGPYKNETEIRAAMHTISPEEAVLMRQRGFE